jgi:hypothetical protein
MLFCDPIKGKSCRLSHQPGASSTGPRRARSALGDYCGASVSLDTRRSLLLESPKDVWIRGRLDAQRQRRGYLRPLVVSDGGDQPGFASNHVARAVFLSRSGRLDHLRGARRCLWTGRGRERQVASWIGHEGACTRVFQGDSSNVAYPRLNPAPNGGGGFHLSSAALPSEFFRRARASSCVTDPRRAMGEQRVAGVVMMRSLKLTGKVSGRARRAPREPKRCRCRTESSSRQAIRLHLRSTCPPRCGMATECNQSMDRQPR